MKNGISMNGKPMPKKSPKIKVVTPKKAENNV
jgi:hypothetical protein